MKTALVCLVGAYAGGMTIAEWIGPTWIGPTCPDWLAAVLIGAVVVAGVGVVVAIERSFR
jgi:hypothetical protein